MTAITTTANSPYVWLLTDNLYSHMSGRFCGGAASTAPIYKNWRLEGKNAGLPAGDWMMAEQSAAGEWRTAWPLPFVAMLGVSGSAAFAYSGGVFLTPLIEEFGWSRTEFSTAFTIQMLLGLIYVPFVGRLVDRYGSRRLALIGGPLYILGMATLGLVGDQIWQWWLLCVLQGLCTALIIPTVWVSAVASRFDASRGLAMSIALAGISFGTAIWPVLAAAYIDFFGWRAAFGAMALTWAIPAIPLTFWLFFSARDLDRSIGNVVVVDPPKLGSVLCSRQFIFLALAGGLFAAMSFGLTMHFVPLLKERSISTVDAASVAALIGVFAILGRIGMGALLDRYPTRPIAIIIFLLPCLVAFLLINAGADYVALAIAAAISGLAQGAEIDIITYIAARQFGPQIFGSVYSVLLASVSVGASAGPLVAGSLYDLRGDYGLYLLAIIPVTLISAILVALIPDAAPISSAHSSEA